MKKSFRRRIELVYERLLRREISGAPTHIAVIQDGNRRHARQKADDISNPHRAGAQTTEHVLEWSQEIGVEELTLYTFSTENFNRPAKENERLFDLLCEKLQEFAGADRVHDNEVAIRVIGDVERLPQRVRAAVRYAEEQTAGYDQFVLNIALAYGGRSKLLDAIRSIAHDVDDGVLRPADVDVETVEDRLYNRSVRSVDLIIRTGGAERTSNFLPWHASGNEAAVFFCTPYWPEFSKIDFLRGIRTYESREESWRRTRAKRALALLNAVNDTELADARAAVHQFRDSLSTSEHPEEVDFDLTEEDKTATE